MTEQTWFAVLQYAGQGFAGWQRQASARTVQGEVEAALARLDGARVVTHAAGRTDAGVHALGQVISFRTRRGWSDDDLHRALNALAPPDLWVRRLGAAPAGFNARRDARSRRYRYVVGCDAAARSPFRHPFEWPVCRPLDGGALQSAAQAIIGTHDFRALSSIGQDKPHYRCTVTRAEWRPRPEGAGYILDIAADRFLHRMVRFLVGMSVAIADGRRAADDLPRLLRGTDNRDASPPAPPQGLFLVGVRYDNLPPEGDDD